MNPKRFLLGILILPAVQSIYEDQKPFNTIEDMEAEFDYYYPKDLRASETEDLPNVPFGYICTLFQEILIPRGPSNVKLGCDFREHKKGSQPQVKIHYYAKKFRDKPDVETDLYYCDCFVFVGTVKPSERGSRWNNEFYIVKIIGGHNYFLIREEAGYYGITDYRKFNNETLQYALRTFDLVLEKEIVRINLA